MRKVPSGCGFRSQVEDLAGKFRTRDGGAHGDGEGAVAVVDGGDDRGGNLVLRRGENRRPGEKGGS